MIGVLLTPFLTPWAKAQRFRRPVACSTCIANWYYFDHDPRGTHQDWNCGRSSYNGHRGTDFSLRGGLPAIEMGHEVVAGADGVVEAAVDGFEDRCTECVAGASPCGTGAAGGFGNHVRIRHGSLIAIYAHLRRGSVRVRPGETVRCGQVIGQIGSSGCSTGAHLHFEVRRGSTSGTAFDPFAGPCSPTSPSSWLEQGAYRALPGERCEGSFSCPPGWHEIWTCSGEQERRRCVHGMQMVESCLPGRCEARPVGSDDVCDRDGDSYAPDEGDCDDMNPAVHPGAPERCGNGVDEDCRNGDAPCLEDAWTPPPPDAWTPPLPDAWSSPQAPLDAHASEDHDAFDEHKPTKLAGSCACRVGLPRRFSLSVPCLCMLLVLLALSACTFAR
ncbi:MAG: peptidoglycan DD-metalloendopeptidase family protein [Sandaracinaceae bacterium]|nr:peptidoglycan DD-metalloendopeptidase family protein [Sandaracinaceae bacterium]